jgi:hypothetical protein
MQPQHASTYAPTPSPRPIRRRTRCLRLPVETVLTPLVLTSAARRLPNAELEAMIDALIAETDARAGDTDLEDDTDLEPDDI